MCGIAGIIGSSDLKVLERMLSATQHRGPINTGVYNNNKITIGMNRLSIIDLSESANQPFKTDDGRLVMVYNGEVYNYQELQYELKREGYTFNTESDTEVVFKAYLAYGKDMLKKIRGMFAFAIWDNVDNTLFAARDHLGIKPFLWSYKKNDFIFCSELKGILASGYFNSNDIDELGLNTFITIGHSIAPSTAVKDVFMLKAGYYLEYCNGKISTTQYWNPNVVTPLTSDDISYDEAVLHIRELVLKSVEEQLIADVPLGVFLSGGLDSTIITAAMHVLGKSNIETFTVGFEEKVKRFDESDIASEIASFYGTNHHDLTIKEDEVVADFEDFITAIDQPSRDGLNTYLVSKHVSKHVTVALSGLGGDELFAGYQGMFQYLTRNKNGILDGVDKLIESPIFSSLFSDQFRRKAYSYQALNDDLLHYLYVLRPHFNIFVDHIFKKRITNPDQIYKEVCEFISKNYQFSLPAHTKTRLIFISLHMINLLLRDSDSVAMKHSLEVRFPIIDVRITEFAMQMPQEYLIKDISTASQRNYEKTGLKQMLRDAFIKELPTNIFNQSKRGFQLPQEEWLRGSLKPFVKDVINNPSFFNPAYMKNLYKDGAFNSASTKIIWGILVWDKWYKLVFSKYAR